MGLLGSLGRKVKGLLGDEQFFGRLAQAQAFANGDPGTAAKIGFALREMQPTQGEAETAVAPAAARPEFAIAGMRPLPLPGRTIPRGFHFQGRTYVGGDPTDPASWVEFA